MGNGRGKEWSRSLDQPNKPNLKGDGEIKRIWVSDGDERRKGEIFLEFLIEKRWRWCHGEGRRS
jgi:hypothetical protein